MLFRIVRMITSGSRSKPSEEYSGGGPVGGSTVDIEEVMGLTVDFFLVGERGSYSNW
ncbi:hypothetical protein HanRHA438_Chr10g0431951 [Helianthus annuus]|nr:hypothetical protein HanIR_Chr10g0452211 [Helianthus annuus]KAJ0877750.1 hypothetical protein HanRHA438_Chr10g0431951 [Helianthus annuus]